jgi:exopolysaccharide production protein ExoQ
MLTTITNLSGPAGEPPVGETTLEAIASRRRFYWIVGVFAILVQESAFIASPAVSNLVVDSASTDAQANIFNTLAVSLNILLLLPVCLSRYRRTLVVMSDNKSAVALMLLIFLSIAWSIHPDITFRRSINYFSTILTACFFAIEFDFEDFMLVISRATAIAAFGSFVFAAAFPLDSIHQQSLFQFDDIAGSWRGAFAHKNVLGQAMAIGVLAELCILVGNERKVWHGLLLVICTALVVLSRSSTSIVLTSLYLIGGVLLFLRQYARRYLGLGFAALAAAMLAIAAIYFADPDAMLELLGRDATLTGRTELWGFVTNLISERPLLGWGYAAMWLPNEPIALTISQYLGWTVPHSHNAALEVALDLGFVGLAVVLVFVLTSLWRAVRCIAVGEYRLGMTSLVFFIGLVLSGATEATFAQNQNISCLFFNVLTFTCGLKLRRQLLDPIEPAREFQ